MFVVPLQPVTVLEYPGDGGGGRVEPVGGFRLAQQQDGGARDLPPDGEPGLVEEGGVVPARQVIGEPWVLGGELLAGQGDGLLAEVVEGGVVADRRAPVVLPALVANPLDLVDGERAKRLAVAPVVVAVPRHRHALGRGRNLEQQHPSVGMLNGMDLDEGQAVGGLVGDLLLQRLELPVALAEVGADHPMVVLHPEHQPGAGQALEVGLVAQRRDIPAELVEAVGILRLLELDDLAFARAVEKLLKLVFGLHQAIASWRAGSSTPGTRILPVTALSIRVARYSLRRSIWP